MDAYFLSNNCTSKISFSILVQWVLVSVECSELINIIYVFRIIRKCKVPMLNYCKLPTFFIFIDSYCWIYSVSCLLIKSSRLISETTSKFSKTILQACQGKAYFPSCWNNDQFPLISRLNMQVSNQQRPVRTVQSAWYAQKII